MLSRSLSSCCRCQAVFRGIVGGFTPATLQTTRLFQTNSYFRFCASAKPPWENESRWKRISRFRLTMSEEEKARKLKAIEHSKREDPPQGLIAKLKFYTKRYWYIAIPVHTINCSIWFAALYLAVRSGVDVIGLLETLHMPDSIIQKVKNVPESAGHVVVALLLYKIAMPLRYAVTIGALRVTFSILKNKFGLLKTARELEFQVRSRYEALNKRRLSGAFKFIDRNKEKHLKRVSKPPTKTN